MKIIVYVNFQEQEVISEREYQKRIKDQVKESLNDGDAVFDYCMSNNIGVIDIWFFSEQEKAEHVKDYEKYLNEVIDDEFSNYWEKFELDI